MDDITPLIIVALIVLAGLTGSWIVRSHFEASAYNRLTEGNATTWDAMWVQLRVDGNR